MIFPQTEITEVEITREETIVSFLINSSRLWTAEELQRSMLKIADAILKIIQAKVWAVIKSILW